MGLISDIRVKTSEYQAYWKLAVEGKTSKTGGLHNGHFKAGANSGLISQVDAALQLILYLTGYAPINGVTLQTWQSKKRAVLSCQNK